MCADALGVCASEKKAWGLINLLFFFFTSKDGSFVTSEMFTFMKLSSGGRYHPEEIVHYPNDYSRVQGGTILEVSRAVLIFKSSNILIAMHHYQYIIPH